MPRIERPAGGAPGGASESVPDGGPLQSLRVEPIRVSPAFDQPSLVFRLGPEEYGDDFYHEFFVLPSEWLRQAMTEWWAGTGMFSQVTSGGSLLRPDLSWETRVSSMYFDVTDDEAPVAVLEIRGALLRGQDVEFETQGVFTEAMADTSAEAGVAALGRAVSRAFNEAELLLRDQPDVWRAPREQK